MHSFALIFICYEAAASLDYINKYSFLKFYEDVKEIGKALGNGIMLFQQKL